MNFYYRMIFTEMTSQNFATIDNTQNNYGLLSEQQINGRVDLLSKFPEFNVRNFQTTQNNNNYKNEAIKFLGKNSVSDLFFSALNINTLQDGLRYKIYQETNGKFTIGKQSEQELKIIMRSIYLQYSTNDDGDCVAQVKKLNSLVLNWAVPEVLSNLLQYQTYRKDASTLPIPMEHPQLLTQKGSRQEEFVSFM